MRTFSIQTLGCKVNQYESEQVATLLRRRGLMQVPIHSGADLRVVNTCSVTQEAAVKSRQTVRRATRLTVLGNPENKVATDPSSKTLVMGCWSTSNSDQAKSLPGVDAVLTHGDPIAETIERFLDRWQGETIIHSKATPMVGACSLPLLDARHTNHVRAYLKIQDGCDAHCTYCIIPRLRPNLWSKPIDDAVEEARRLVDAGHAEIILTGIFMGAYGQPTALRRRQTSKSELTNLIDALCTRVSDLKRLRLSSLEPGDLTDDLISCLRAHEQVVPHFHLPLQSGSREILRKMNRQYSRDDFLEMLDRVDAAFDRPALTTDIISGFPGETEEDFAETMDVVDRAKFIHVHAFPYSAREHTAAARWTDKAVPRDISRERVNALSTRASIHSFAFRKQFVGSDVEILVERQKDDSTSAVQHGRCERYFDVEFEANEMLTGQSVQVRIDAVSSDSTLGTIVGSGQ